MGWPRGSTALVRHVRAGAVRVAISAIVVDDGPNGLVLWVPPGSPALRRRLADGRRLREAPLHERFTAPRGEPKPDPWQGNGILMLVPPAEDWSVWWFFAEDGSFRNWYGNLERRHVRWRLDDEPGDSGGCGVIDTADHALDVVIDADRTCHWKDEDEFAVATGLPGFWTATDAIRIRAAGERLIRLAGVGEFPFDGTWCDFRPDPAWPVPKLPSGWDSLPR